MTEQFLDHAQIRTAFEEMRSERMAQRVRRRAFGKRECAADARHQSLHDARCERTALCATEERRPTLEAERRANGLQMVARYSWSPNFYLGDQKKAHKPDIPVA